MQKKREGSGRWKLGEGVGSGKVPEGKRGLYTCGILGKYMIKNTYGEWRERQVEMKLKIGEKKEEKEKDK